MINSPETSTRIVSLTTETAAVRPFTEKPAIEELDGPNSRTSPDELFSYFTASVIKAEIIRPAVSTVKL